ncbi:MAG: hypothetical protein ACODAJ_15270, partial [Planctomycetota bacterium]
MAFRARSAALRLAAAALMTAAALPAGAYSIYDLQAVDAAGNPTDPLVGAGPTILTPPDQQHPDDPTRPTVQGIVLNSPEDFSLIDPDVPGWQYWQVYVQSEEPGKPAGIAVFQGMPWAQSWPPAYPEVVPGDRVEVNGFVSDHWGKSNINARHTATPLMDFTVTVLDHPGMPDPVQTPDLADCTYFSNERLDEPGKRGGEYYQAQWCELSNVWIADPPAEAPPWGDGWGWAPGKSVLVTDASGETLPLYLGALGEFDAMDAPDGP